MSLGFYQAGSSVYVISSIPASFLLRIFRFSTIITCNKPIQTEFVSSQAINISSARYIGKHFSISGKILKSCIRQEAERRAKQSKMDCVDFLQLQTALVCSVTSNLQEQNLFEHLTPAHSSYLLTISLHRVWSQAQPSTADIFLASPSVFMVREHTPLFESLSPYCTSGLLMSMCL